MYTGGVGDTEIGVDVQGVLPVLAGLIQLVGGLAGAGQTVVGAGLLVAVAGLAGEA